MCPKRKKEELRRSKEKRARGNQRMKEYWHKKKELHKDGLKRPKEGIVCYVVNFLVVLYMKTYSVFGSVRRR